MTTERLYDLLDELVVDLTPVDTVDAAWDRARSTRRRRRLAVSASSAMAVIAVAVGVAVLDGSDPSSRPAVTTPSATPTPTPTEDKPATGRPDTTYAGIGVFWSPTLAEEADLPWYDGVSPLPRTIGLAEGAPEISGEERALAVFPVFGGNSLARIVVLLTDGTSRSLDASRLEPVRDEEGNAGGLMPVNGGLAADGRHVFFAQNSSIEVYEFATGTWTTIDTPDWQAEGARWLDDETIWLPTGETFGIGGRSAGMSDVDWVPGELVQGADVYGPVKTHAAATAQSQRVDGPVSGGGLANPEAIGVRQGRQLYALAFSGMDRTKGCCPVVGWLGEDTVVFRSQNRLLAWRVGTHEVTRVAEVANGLATGSWADLTD